MSIVDVPVTRPNGKGHRLMHPHLVTIPDVDASRAVLVAQDEHNGIAYRHHQGQLFRSASRHEYVYGHVRRSLEPISLEQMREGAKWLQYKAGHERSALGVSHLAPVLHLHRLFTELRSLRDRNVGIFDTRFTNDREVSASTIAAERLAARMMFVDGILYVPSLPPVGRVAHDHRLTAHIVPTHPDFVDYDLAGRLRDPREEWIDAKSSTPTPAIFGPGQKLVVHVDELLPRGAIEAYDTERMAWSVLARLAECAISAFEFDDVDAFALLRRRLVERAARAGVDASRSQRYPYACDRLDFEEAEGIEGVLMRLKGAYMPRARAKTKAETADMSSWFDVRRTASVDELEDFAL